AVGVIYRQFSVTIVSAMLLSVAVALVLTPALSATMLRPVRARRQGVFGWFNRGFDRAVLGYLQGLRGIIRRPLPLLIVFVLIGGGIYYLFTNLASSFLPEEDQGVLMTQIQLPVGATTARTLEVVRQVEDYYLTHEKDNVDSVFVALGFGFSGGGQNAA